METSSKSFFLGLVPESPLLVNAFQFAVAQEIVKYPVNLLFQGHVVLAHRDPVHPLAEGRSLEAQLGIGLPVVNGDGKVQQHGVQPSQRQVHVRLGLAGVHLDVHAPDVGGAADAVQYVLRHRAGQRSDFLSFQVVERLDAGFFFAHDELLGVDVIGRGEQELLFSLRGDLDPVHDDIKVAPLERRQQAVPGVLNLFGLDAQLGRDGAGDVHLKTFEDFRILGVPENIRRAALGVGAPEQYPALLDLVEGGQARPGQAQIVPGDQDDDKD